MGLFDSKDFNSKAFTYMVGHVPNLVKNELIKSGAVVTNNEYGTTMKEQNGVNYMETAVKGLIEGDSQNYDGQTNLTTSSTKTYTKKVQAIGRMNGWGEKDFAVDVTGGEDFMGNIAGQVGTYWQTEKQKNLLAVLKGVFAMTTGKANQNFVTRHTYVCPSTIQATTLNNAITKACGDNKGKFSLVIMHSDVATQLENLNLLEYKKYTDPSGITSNLPIGTWSGKTVLIDDDMPTEIEYTLTTDTALDPNKVYYTKTGDVYNEVTNPDVSDIATYYEASMTYTTYALGAGAIEYCDLGCETPNEMVRDAKTAGGKTELVSRTRFLFSPRGISYEKASQSTDSPTIAELENGANWSLAHSNESVAANRSYVNHRAIPIVKITSK